MEKQPQVRSNKKNEAEQQLGLKVLRACFQNELSKKEIGGLAVKG